MHLRSQVSVGDSEIHIAASLHPADLPRVIAADRWEAYACRGAEVWRLILEHSGRVLDQRGRVGVDNGVQVVHLDVTFEPEVLLALG